MDYSCDSGHLWASQWNPVMRGCRWRRGRAVLVPSDSGRGTQQLSRGDDRQGQAVLGSGRRSGDSGVRGQPNLLVLRRARVLTLRDRGWRNCILDRAAVRQHTSRSRSSYIRSSTDVGSGGESGSGRYPQRPTDRGHRSQLQRRLLHLPRPAELALARVGKLALAHSAGARFRGRWKHGDCWPLEVASYADEPRYSRRRFRYGLSVRRLGGATLN